MWCEEGWTPQIELLATIAERVDGWGRAQFALMNPKHQGQVELPGKVEFVRPERDEAPPPKRPTDPNEIARFFGETPPASAPGAEDGGAGEEEGS